MSSPTIVVGSAKTIIRVPLDSLGHGDNVLDITSCATPRRYRLVDCKQLVDHNILQIDEFASFPSIPYSTLSYVWRGSPADPTHPESTFSVKGAGDADPIGISVLRHAFTSSLLLNTSYFWVDRLCIMQTSREDKDWQIANMYRVYESCAHTVILPGGVQRLVRLDEETDWIHRGWTLQEALAPSSALVLFAWRLGTGEALAGEGGVETSLGTIREVVAGESAMAPLANVLNSCIVGYTSFIATSNRCGTHEPLKIKARIFGVASPNAVALAIAMTPGLHALDVEETPLKSDSRSHAIWQSSLLRTSSRPVDMVFSIMGLFGVRLDTRAFHRDDRLGATIALAKEILHNGGRAAWVGLSFLLPRSAKMSTFPQFPKTSVSGKALVEDKDGHEVEASKIVDAVVSPNMFPLDMMRMPVGTMDKDGCLIFTRKAVRLMPMEREVYVKECGGRKLERRGENVNKSPCVAMDGSIWRVVAAEEHLEGGKPRAYAVVLGWYDEYYPGVTPAHDSFQLKAMLVMEGEPNRHHVVSFITWTMDLRSWIFTWEEREFCIGKVSKRAAPIRGNMVTDDDIIQTVLDPDRRMIHNYPRLTLAGSAKRRMERAKTQPEHEEQWARMPDVLVLTEAEPSLQLHPEWAHEHEVSMDNEHGWRQLVKDPVTGQLMEDPKYRFWDD
ncbi:hypothetical protein OF83DRAFT_1070114 [Amylostereum chailletii]|nr:hypothetical protein OF83DRAFT_1070114 [Amylostereum chailletii]